MYHQQITMPEKIKVLRYLENPVSCGLWQLEGDWSKESGISIDIWKEIEKEINNKDSITIKSGKRVRKIITSQEWKAELEREVCCTVTFIFSLFDYLVNQDEQCVEDSDKYGVTHETTQLVLDMIDIAPIKIKYSRALELFREKIWHSELNPSPKIRLPLKISSGTVIIFRGPRANFGLAVTSWESSPIKDLEEFLKAAGQIENSTVMPVFSPEEEVFIPYFDLLGLAHDALTPQKHIQDLISKSIRNFKEEHFTDCVNAIGIAFEDILTQIYETLYREQLNKGLTLGQLTDEINSRAAASFKKKDEPPQDLSALYPEIRAALEEENLPPTRSIEIIRKLINLSQEINKQTQTRINKIGRPERKLSVWPESVDHAVNELIRYRNAASHKSRIPIGPMECRRSAHSFVVTTRWWLEEKKKTDWSKTPEEILRTMVEKYSKGFA